MRREFVRALVDLGERDPRVVLLTGDLGYMALEPFAERFPGRFFNVGVAEQNMLGLATGLAESGYVPFAYSIATFASMRPYEFLRDGPILHSLPVRLVGIGGGLDYGHNGVSHFALEDVSLMRTQPDLTVMIPAHPRHAAQAVAATEGLDRPVYLRLERVEQDIPALDEPFRVGGASLVGDGDDVAIVAVGSCAEEALTARELLADQGVHATVAIVTTFNPSPVDDLRSLVRRVPLVVTAEAHLPNGGLRSFVAETIAEAGCGCRLVSHTVDTLPRAMSGSREFLYEHYRLSAGQLVSSALEALESRSARP
ncbi:MAG TPA: transketolase C-terminal domain-containing protein [Gaiellaceae bacterium]|nr:transketolase C-terminal domain-containing protein [Gaiellaceae bacterium]